MIEAGDLIAGAQRRAPRNVMTRIARTSTISLPLMCLGLSLANPAQAQLTIAATAGADYATAATATAASTNVTITNVTITNTGGATIDLTGVSPLAIGPGTLQIGDGIIDSPIANGALTVSGTLNFVLPNGANDTVSTVLGGSGTIAVSAAAGTATQTTLTLSGSNASGGIGALTIDGGATATSSSFGLQVYFPTTDSVPGYPTAANFITLSNYGGIATGSAIDQALLNSLTSASVGYIGLGANAANDLNFTSPQLTQVSLTAVTTTPTAPTPRVLSGNIPFGILASPGSLDQTFNQIQFGGGNGILIVSSNLVDGSDAGTIKVYQNVKGYTVLSGTNTFQGGMAVNAGVLQLASPAAFCTIATSGCLNQGTPLGTIGANGVVAVSYALDQATVNAFDGGGSSGIIALGANSSNSLDFTNLPAVTLGVVGASFDAGNAFTPVSGYTFSGTLLPGSQDGIPTYRLGGGGGFAFEMQPTLTVTSVLADSGGPTTLVIDPIATSPGIVLLTGANTFTGATTIGVPGAAVPGMLTLGDGVSTGTINSSSGVTNNGVLTFNESGDTTFDPAISGPGSVVQQGPGAVTITSLNSYGGGTTIAAGTNLILGGTAAGAANPTAGSVGVGTVTNNGTLTFNEPTAITVRNIIGGSGAVIQSGAATVTFEATNTYGGGTSIAGGSTLQLGGETVGTAGSGPVANGGTLILAEPTDLTLANVIGGTGSLVKNNGNTITLTGSSTLSGPTTINAGTLTLGGATVGLLGTGPITNNAALVFAEPSAVTFANPIGGAGTLTQNGPGMVTVTSVNNGFTGTTTIAGGILLLGSGANGAAGTTGTGPIAVTGGTLVFNEPAAQTLANAISGAGGIIQNGPGTITLTGISTNTGTTDIAGGTLIVGDTAGSTATLGGAITVDAAGTLAGYGTVGAPGMTLTNNGTVIPGSVAGDSSGVLNVLGNYTQGAGGTLVIAVTPSSASELKVSGGASLNGTLKYAFAPGTYAPGVHTVVKTVGVISGNFTSHIYGGSAPIALSPTTTIVHDTVIDDEVNLVLTAAPAVPGAPAPVPVIVVAPTDPSIFSEQLASFTRMADAAAMTLLDGGRASNDCFTADPRPTPGQGGMAADAQTGIAAIGKMLCQAGGWIHMDGVFAHVNGSGGRPDYHADTAGFLAGVDRPVGDSGLRLGIAAGYDYRSLGDGAGGDAKGEVARVGLYAIMPVGPIVLNGAILYGHEWESTTRPTGIGNASAQYGGNEVSGGVRASLPLTMSRFDLVPMAGVRFASVSAGSFNESTAIAATAFKLNGAATSESSVIPYARVVLSRTFLMDDGVRVAPYGAVGFQYQGGQSQTAVGLTAQDGTLFSAGSSNADRSAGTLGLGLSAARANWAVFAAYGATIAGNWQAQEVDLGLRVAF